MSKVNFSPLETFFVIGIPNKEVKDGLYDFAASKGIRVYWDVKTSLHSEFPNITWDGTELCGNCSRVEDLREAKRKILTVTEFIEAVENYKPNRLKLTDEYTADIDFGKKVVKVGCQTIPFSKVTELYRMINK